MIRKCAPFLTALAGFLITLWLFAPGMMSADSINQYEQAISGGYTDHHPPILSFIWRGLLFLSNDQLPILILHATLFWTGLLLLSFGLVPGWYQSLFIAIGFFPPVLVQLGMIWKDVTLLSFYIFALGIIAVCRRAQYKVTLLVGAFICLWIGTAARHNGIAAVLPLLVFFFLLNHSLLRSILFAFLVLTVFYFAESFFNNEILKVHSVNAEGQIFIYDTVAIAAKTHDFSLIPKYLSEDLHTSNEELVGLYNPVSCNGVLYHNGKYLLPVKDSWYQESRLAWINAIKKYPKEYLRHRVSVFLSVIGFSSEEVYYPWHTVVDSNPYQLHASSRRITEHFLFFIDTLKKGYFLRVWVYMLLSFVTLVGLFIRPQRIRNFPDPVIVFCQSLLVSGLCYSGLYFFIAPASDLRLNYWTIDATVIAVAVIVIHWLHTYNERQKRNSNG